MNNGGGGAGTEEGERGETETDRHTQRQRETETETEPRKSVWSYIIQQLFATYTFLTGNKKKGFPGQTAAWGLCG